MGIKFDEIFWNEALANAMGTVIGGVVVSFLGYLVIDPVRQWTYKQSPRLARFLLWIIDKFSNPIVWFVGFFIFQVLLYFNIQRIWSLIGTSLILIRFFRSSHKEVLSYPSKSSQFSDSFSKLEDIKYNWEIVTGEPSLDENKGNPEPSLLLNMTSPVQATNTFILLKKIQVEKGEIECDIYLEQGAVLNIVFMADKGNHNWHMARYESRSGCTDGLLIKDGSKGNNWRFNNMSTSKTNPESWYKAKVEFSNERARMFRNGELISEIIDPQPFGKYIGIFNECAGVHVDNFKLSEN